MLAPIIGLLQSARFTALLKRRVIKVSDFNTYEITVLVAIRVSAYDKEHAVNVASELLSPVDGVMFVKGAN